MIVELNGKPTELPDGAALIDAVNAAGADTARGVAAAVGGEVIPRERWEDYVLAEGIKVEVVKAVQGG